MKTSMDLCPQISQYMSNFECDFKVKQTLRAGKISRFKIFER